MRLVIAKTAGFCMGVRRAVEMVLDAPAQYQKPIYTYGPLIHNPQVLELFAEKGVTVLDHIPEKGYGTVIIRAHGVPPEAKQALRQAGFRVIDATCPRVVKVQSIIKRNTRKGAAAIIIGDEDHPEVVGLMGHAGGRGYVVNSLEAMAALPPFDQAILVAQTTQNYQFYQQVKDWVATHRPHYTVFETICDSTDRRQAEVRWMADQVDTVIVVGGKTSGNTRRLAEIVKASGKPVYHVETEAELDSGQLTEVQTIGITAGASTPNWIIKRILRSLEQIPLHRNQGWHAALFRIQRMLLLSNIYLALGAGCLSFAVARLQGIPVPFSVLAAAVLYVFSMHIFNHLTGRAEDKYNDPDRERFYNRYKWPFTIMALAAGTLGLVAAFEMGPIPFWTLLTMSFLGLSYNLRIIPAMYLKGRRIRRIRDIPGSKTILIALAWGVVTVLLPAFTAHDARLQCVLLVFIWTTGLVFCRTVFFDILDMQGDRIVGKETLPILLGSRKSFQLLKGVLAFIMVLLPIAGVLGLLTPLTFVMTIAPLFLWCVLVGHERGNMLPGIRMEFLVESLFVLCGVLTLLYKII
jgi:(E)-4-hydroxy-3-methyl-but-2-enyl pyrophosphate reductase